LEVEVLTCQAEAWGDWLSGSLGTTSLARTRSLTDARSASL